MFQDDQPLMDVVLGLVMGRLVGPDVAPTVDVAGAHDADLARAHAGEQLEPNDGAADVVRGPRPRVRSRPTT